MQQKFTIQKAQGKVKGAALRAYLDTLPDGSYSVVVKKERRSKSLPQNSYLHVLMGIVAQEFNKEYLGDGRQWTIERVKDYCKREGLYPMEDVLLPGGVITQMPKATRELDKDEMGYTIDNLIRHFAEEFGIILPQPHEQVNLGF